MRGFWADERVDGGLWRHDSRLYRLAKGFERRLLLNADHVISLTHAGVREIEKFPYLTGRMPPTTVISTCADLSRFRLRPKPAGSFVLGYVGSAGTWYEFDAAVACFAELLKLKPDATLLIINRHEHAYIRERLAAGGILPGNFELRSATHAEVPELMARMHAGLFFIKPVFSKQASAPTKLGEFLGSGIPCIANSGVGDMAEILEGDQVGIAVAQFTSEALRAGTQRLLALVESPGVEARCVAAAQRHFSLSRGVEQYRRLYEALEKRA
jgi:glycosyltransferase involved in cell wall biosynthesis